MRTGAHSRVLAPARSAIVGGDCRRVADTLEQARDAAEAIVVAISVARSDP